MRDRLLEANLVRDVPNEDIYPEFYHLLTPLDYIIYGIPYEGEDVDDP